MEETSSLKGWDGGAARGWRQSTGSGGVMAPWHVRTSSWRAGTTVLVGATCVWTHLTRRFAIAPATQATQAQFRFAMITSPSYFLVCPPAVVPDSYIQ